MSHERMVTLTTFSNPIEAELAKNRLLDEGIAAHLLGDTGSNPFAGVGGLFGQMALMVNEADAGRASRVIADEDRGELPELEEPDTAIRAPEWAQTDVGAEDDPETKYRAADPHYQLAKTAKEERFQGGEPNEDQPAARLEPNDEEPDLTWSPDAVVSRAWRVAVVGLMLFPFVLASVGVLFALLSLGVILYSIALLIYLATLSGEMSSAGMKKLYGALVVDGVVVVGVLLFFFSVFFRVLRW